MSQGLCLRLRGITPDVALLSRPKRLASSREGTTIISKRDQPKAFEAHDCLEQLIDSLPERDPFRRVRAHLVEAEALLKPLLAEGVELSDKTEISAGEVYSNDQNDKLLGRHEENGSR